MNNILITSASRKVTLVKNFKKALNGMGKVIAMDISPEAPALYFADEYVIGLRSDNSKFMDSIVDLCKQKDIKLIIPTRDEELLLFSKNQAIFDEIGVKLMVSGVETIETCQDKIKFIDFCEKNGFNVPKTFNSIDEIKREDYPLFLKPVVGKGGADTHKVESREDLEVILKSGDEEFIIQECILADEYTIDLFADFDSNVISAVPRQRVNVWGGESLVTKTVKNEQLIGEAVRLASALGLKGHNTIQCFFDGETISFIEVNPRFGGAASISFKAGANSAEFLLKLLNGDRLEPQIGEFEDKLIALRYVEDYFINEDCLGE